MCTTGTILKERFIRITMVVIFALGISTGFGASDANAKEYEKTFRNSNADYGNYCAWNNPQHETSAMGIEDSGFFRVDNVTDSFGLIEPLDRDEITGHEDGVVLVEHYDKNFKYLSQTWVKRELPKYGGFYQGSDGYYFLFGNNNPNQDDSAEVWRIVKYDKSWNREASTSLYGGETGVWDSIAIPSASFYEYDGLLYIDTNLEGYSSSMSEEIHHQWSYLIVLKTSDMSIVKHGDYQSISHSIRQFIMRDREGRVVVFEQCDGSPERGAVLERFATSDDGTGIGGRKGYFSGEIANTLYYGFNENSREDRDAAGNNETHATIGGFVETRDNYITAGSSTYQKKDESREWPIHNAYITITPKDNFTEAATKLVWLTSYEENKNDIKMAGTPYIVKVSDDLICVMWSVGTGLHATSTMQFVFIDGSGNQISDVKTVTGKLSDCDPVVSNINGNETIYWTVNTGADVVLYSLTTDGNITSKNASGFPSSMYIFPRKMDTKMNLYCNYIGSIPAGYSDADPDLMIKNRFSIHDKSFPGGERILTFEEDFNTAGPSGIKMGGEWTTVGFKVTGLAPYYYGVHKYKSHTIPKSIQVDHTFYSNHAATVRWYDACNGAMGYTLYRKIGSGSYKKIKTYKNNTKKRWWKYVDKGVKSSQKISYKIIAYTKNKQGKKISTTNKPTSNYPALNLGQNSATLQPGETLQLKVTEKVSNKKVTFTSSNTKVARVSSSGKVTAVSPGTATITAKCGKQRGTCIITVEGLVASQEKLLKEFISDAESHGASMIDDIYDSTYYKWDKEGYLTFLMLSENGLQGKIDFSKFTRLETLYIADNPDITDIDISGNASLKQFSLTNVGVKNIDISKNGALEEMDLQKLELNSVDVSQNSNLKILFLEDVGFKQVDISNNTKLESLLLHGMDVSGIDLSKYPSLARLVLENCGLSGSMDLSNRSALADIDVSENPGLTSVTVKGCPALESFVASNTGMTSIDFSGCKSLPGFDTTEYKGSPILSIDMSGCSSLEYFVYKHNETGAGLKEVNFTGCTKVNRISISMNQLNSINLKDCHSLTELNLSAQKAGVVTAGEYGGVLTEIDLSGCPNLETINLRGNHIKKLDITGLVKLERLSIDNCGMEVIVFDPAGNPALETLEATMNDFKEIVAPNMPALKTVYLTGCPNLTKVEFSGSPLLATLMTDPGVQKASYNTSIFGGLFWLLEVMVD